MLFPRLILRVWTNGSKIFSAFRFADVRMSVRICPENNAPAGTKQLFCANRSKIVCPTKMPFCKIYFSLAYSFSSTGSNHSLLLSSPGTSMARWENQLSGAAPCQCFTPAGMWTASPGRSSTGASSAISTPPPGPDSPPTRTNTPGSAARSTRRCGFRPGWFRL